jgi:hypothetical protein
MSLMLIMASSLVFGQNPQEKKTFKECVPSKGGEPKRLASGTWPVWSADSSRLFFLSRYHEGNLCCIRIDELGAETEEIMTYPGRFVLPRDQMRLSNVDETIVISAVSH